MGLLKLVLVLLLDLLDLLESCFHCISRFFRRFSFLFYIDIRFGGLFGIPDNARSYLIVWLLLALLGFIEALMVDRGLDECALSHLYLVVLLHDNLGYAHIIVHESLVLIVIVVSEEVVFHRALLLDFWPLVTDLEIGLNCRLTRIELFTGFLGGLRHSGLL